jgi:uncharacterized protein (DUF305 family)
MDSLSHNKINVSSHGLVVILGLLIVIVAVVIWFLYMDTGYSGFRDVYSGFRDVPAAVWQGGYDCPILSGLKTKTLPEADKPCQVIAPVLATPDKVLTDTQFLEYMIGHHQVAVNMAKSQLRTSQNQYILEMARRMVWQQGYEITMMHAMIGRLPQPFSRVAVLGHYNTSLLNFYKGLDQQPVKCYDDMFTDAAHDGMPAMSDRDFLAHMIAHHELGLAMSRAQLNRQSASQSGFMLALLYDIIHDQEQELDRMRGMSAGTLWMNSQVIGH